LDVPEVRQRAPLDCGPAALQSVLLGFGIRVEYDALVKRCEVDPAAGASIDKVEEVANSIGLPAEQTMMPVDHLLLPGSHQGPMMVVIRGPGTLKHFLVLWRANGESVQTMDPATGARAWVDRRDLLPRLFVHEMAVPEKVWKEWSHSDGFRDSVVERMRRLRIPPPARKRLWTDASGPPSIRGIQALDAAIRFEAARGDSANASLDVRRLFDCTKNPACSGRDRVPDQFWSAWETGADKKGEPQVMIRGAVLLTFFDPED